MIKAWIGDYSETQKAALAEYILYRRAIIDVFEKSLEMRDAGDGKVDHHKEEDIHNLICPMGAFNSQLEYGDHNLWLIDDRLAYSNFFASDKQIGTYSNSDSRKEPDLAFFLRERALGQHISR